MVVTVKEAKVYATREPDVVTDMEFRKSVEGRGYVCDPFRGDPDNVLYRITCPKEGYTSGDLATELKKYFPRFIKTLTLPST